MTMKYNITANIFLNSQHIPYANALVNAAEGFENHQACIFDELVQAGNEEEVIIENLLALVQLLPSTIEVEVDVKMLQELGNGIFVGVGFLHKINRG
jgi:hypothetical protein